MDNLLSTREACGLTLLNMGHKEKDIVVLDAGPFGVPHKQKNLLTNSLTGSLMLVCAEQNLIGTAAGLAIGGKTAFAATFAMFFDARMGTDQEHSCS